MVARTRTGTGNGKERAYTPPLQAPDEPIEPAEPIQERVEKLVISEPNFQIEKIPIVGISPYCQHAFSEKTRRMLEEQHRRGTAGKNTRAKKEPRQFESDYLHTMHRSTEGWNGIPAASFRNALISACKVAGFVMTRGKLSVWVLPDGFDETGTALVRIYGEPEVASGHGTQRERRRRYSLATDVEAMERGCYRPVGRRSIWRERSDEPDAAGRVASRHRRGSAGQRQFLRAGLGPL
jgi:hypothetical protein